MFDDLLEQWFQAHDVYTLSLSQIVIECLALHGPLTVDKLVEKTDVKQDDIIKAIDKYSIYENFHLNSFLPLDKDNKQADRKDIYHNFITHLPIIMKKNKDKEQFELSLFGVLLVIILIRRYYLSKADADTRSLFYQHIDEREYIDSIIQNHKDKIPLIFGKWEFLKAHLGKIMLYEEFDSLTDDSIRSYKFDRSIWSRGNKEFYNDIHTLTHNAAMKLIPVYNMGKHLLEQYNRVQPGITKNLRMIPVYQKINNLRNILDNAMFSTSLGSLQEYSHLHELRDIRKIEIAFGEELSLLFYLGLNMMDMLGSKQDLIERQKLKQGN